jgi:hypothetical protein
VCVCVCVCVCVYMVCVNIYIYIYIYIYITFETRKDVVGIPVVHQLAHIELVGVFRQVGLVAHGVHVCAVISATQLSAGHGARRVHSAGPRRSGSLFDWVYVCVSCMRVGACVCVCVRVGAHAARTE